MGGSSTRVMHARCCRRTSQREPHWESSPHCLCSPRGQGKGAARPSGGAYSMSHDTWSLLTDLASARATHEHAPSCPSPNLQRVGVSGRPPLGQVRACARSMSSGNAFYCINVRCDVLLDDILALAEPAALCLVCVALVVGGAVMHAAAGWLVMRHHPRYGFCAECEDPFAKRRRGVNPFDGLVSGIKGP